MLCLLYWLVRVWCSSGVSSVAFLLLGGASVAALASDWTERHRPRIASSCCCCRGACRLATVRHVPRSAACSALSAQARSSPSPSSARWCPTWWALQSSVTSPSWTCLPSPAANRSGMQLGGLHVAVESRPAGSAGTQILQTEVEFNKCGAPVLARPPLPRCPYGPARGSSEAVLACPLPYGSPLPSCLLAGSWAKTCVSVRLLSRDEP